jgi:16S rRNA (guanine527-N7)-methyltransferase
VAIAFKGDPERRFTLVESNGKKAAFLRAAIRETGVHARVAAERIEKHAETMRLRADVISARALAPLPALCGLAAPYMHRNSVLLLLKGRDFAQELREAAKSWNLDVVDSPSATDPGGRVLAIRNLSPKVERT